MVVVLLRAVLSGDQQICGLEQALHDFSNPAGISGGHGVNVALFQLELNASRRATKNHPAGSRWYGVPSLAGISTDW